MWRSLLLLLFISSTIYNSSFAQCCSAGNPFFYDDQSNIDHQQLKITTGYKYSLSDQYYHKSSKEDINFVDKAYFNYLNLQLTYGITEKINLKADLGYYINKTEDYKLANWDNVNGFGLGDARFLVQYLAYKNVEKKISIIPSIGVMIPVGVFDQRVNNIKLPITVQPSSGSYKYLLNTYVSKTYNNKFNIRIFGSAEFPQQIDSDNFYYKYGNLYLFSIAASYYTSNRKIRYGLEIRNENRNKASRENEQIVESSGYNIICLVPHFSYAFNDNWFGGVNADLPVYKFYNGIQLANKFAVSMRFTRKLNFEKKKSCD